MNKPTVLLVDDDIEYRSLIEEILLSEIDILIVISENGKEAMQLLNSGNVDLVITDTNMPQMNGIELLKAIREKSKALPVVVLFSGLIGSTLSDGDVYKLGANLVMTKIEANTKLTEVVQNLILSK